MYNNNDSKNNNNNIILLYTTPSQRSETNGVPKLTCSMGLMQLWYGLSN